MLAYQKNSFAIPLKEKRKNIRGDLDTIVAKALEIEPVNRYWNAGQMADDVENYLEGKRIGTSPMAWHRRYFRWFIRNKVKRQHNLIPPSTTQIRV